MVNNWQQSTDLSRYELSVEQRAAAQGQQDVHHARPGLAEHAWLLCGCLGWLDAGAF